MIEINVNPSARELRRFAWVAVVALPAIGFLLWLRGASVAFAGTLAVVALALPVIAAARPRSLRVFYVGLLMATAPIGWLVSHLMMAIFFYLVLTPMAVLWRLLGRDVLAIRRPETATSYWYVRSHEPRLETYFRQS